MAKGKNVPAGYNTATPLLCVKCVTDAIDFYKQAFDAVEVMRIEGPDGQIGHGEITVGDSMIMLSQERADVGFLSAQTLGASPVSLFLYFDDVDAMMARAIGAGATLLKPAADKFYGDRIGFVKDPFGYTWIIGTRTKEVSLDDVKKLAATGQAAG